MACFTPLRAYPPPPGADRRLVWASNKSFVGAQAINLPCGQCIGCRLAKAAEWTTRLHHENSEHERSSFVTLTFSDEYLPPDYSINVRDLQLFMKRLRKALGHERVRYFACGEYGDNNGRPHYHLLLFGYDFPDRTLWRRTNSGELTYRSAFLETVWPFGHSEIGAVTPQSINYVARYILKKINGEASEEHYLRVHPLTGEVCRVNPEFIVMSSRPGIGSTWFDKFSTDAFPSDFVVIDGIKRPVPRYYMKKLIASEDNQDARQARQVQARRLQRASDPRSKANNTPERLATRAQSATLKVARLKRELDETQ